MERSAPITSPVTSSHGNAGEERLMTGRDIAFLIILPRNAYRHILGLLAGAVTALFRPRSTPASHRPPYYPRRWEGSSEDAAMSREMFRL
jgi:hypothetical protein